MKILISGGHLTPALAFCEYAVAEQNVDLIFAGRQFSQSSGKQESVEKTEVEKRGIRFLKFESGKLSKPTLGEFLTQSIKSVKGFFGAWQIFSTEKPDLFLSFGGYLAVPLACVAWLRKVPIFTHEQTRAPGFANKLIAQLATQVAVSFPETVSFFPAKKTVVTGNPIRSNLLSSRPVQPEWLPAKITLPILYITGGSQGSQFINRLITELLPTLTSEWMVIHQCGKSTQVMNYLAELENAKEKLSTQQKKNYFVQEWVSEEDLSWILQHLKLVISRAGANTVQEISLAGRPVIFIPLLYAHHDEQRKNAEAVTNTGAGLLLDQKETTSATLQEAIKTIVNHYPEFEAQAKLNQELYPKDGAKRLYDLLFQVSKN